MLHPVGPPCIEYLLNCIPVPYFGSILGHDAVRAQRQQQVSPEQLSGRPLAVDKAVMSNTKRFFALNDFLCIDLDHVHRATG